ncbi:hypothetical protein B296_00002977 [Ensete ventricosum]|uniref:Uncharacterized protein n=1 Tax=Ensete ventricosum TaxID=4639 RepID=A0A427AF50_ENSVE|nr:hypothetical protein B296_00002977 [Ensete ventricosum]
MVKLAECVTGIWRPRALVPCRPKLYRNLRDPSDTIKKRRGDRRAPRPMLAFFLISVGAVAVFLSLKPTGPAEGGGADGFPSVGLQFDTFVLFLVGVAMLFVRVWVADGPPERVARVRAVAVAAARAVGVPRGARRVKPDA